MLGQASNSLFYDIAGDALDQLRASTNNAFFQIGGNATSGVIDEQGTISGIDPLWQSAGSPGGGLKHLPRVEPEGAYAKAGQDGKDLGARMLVRIGQPATLWGEPGWTSLTSQDLWPWPHEALIQQAFRSGAADPPSDRGFCADDEGLYGGPITLTSYVWEYLGQACPPEICGGSAGGDGGVVDAGSEPARDLKIGGRDESLDFDEQLTVTLANTGDNSSGAAGIGGIADRGAISPDGISADAHVVRCRVPGKLDIFSFQSC